MKENSRRMFLKTSSLSLGVLSTCSLSALAYAPATAEQSFPVDETTINLWADGSKNNGTDPGQRPSHEGVQLARLFASKGMVAAVLTYRVAPNKFPAPYADAVRAMRIVRSRASEFGIDPARIGLMGFSAGGHLASTVATQPDLYKDPEDNLAATVSARPDRVVLGYPVITFGEFTHAGSVKNLLGDNPSAAQRAQFSGELHVSSQTPPAFIFHTADDGAVPVQNAFLFAEACVRNKVPVALHVYPRGKHGVGMALDNPELSGWTEVLLRWLADWHSV
jgi:acetyl esterase/lipase